MSGQIGDPIVIHSSDSDQDEDEKRESNLQTLSESQHTLTNVQSKNSCHLPPSNSSSIEFSQNTTSYQNSNSIQNLNSTQNQSLYCHYVFSQPSSSKIIAQTPLNKRVLVPLYSSLPFKNNFYIEYGSFTESSQKTPKGNSNLGHLDKVDTNEKIFNPSNFQLFMYNAKNA